MSTPISKLDMEGREKIGPLNTRIPEARHAPVKPQQAVPGPADEPSTSYAAMLREAYDGDAAEAMAVAAGPRRTGEDSGGSRSAAVAELPHERAVTRVSPVDRDGKSAEFLAQLRGRRDATPVTAGEPVVASPEHTASSTGQLHERLMLVSSKMDVSQIATHIALRSFVRLTRILSQQNWMRQRSCLDQLMPTSQGLQARTR